MAHAGMVRREQSVAGAIRVANSRSRYRFRWQYPGQAATDDLRCTTTFETPELPLPLRFYFLEWTDEDGGHGYKP